MCMCVRDAALSPSPSPRRIENFKLNDAHRLVLTKNVLENRLGNALIDGCLLWRNLNMRK